MLPSRFARTSLLLAALFATVLAAPSYAADDNKDPKAAAPVNTVRPEVAKLLDQTVFKDLLAQNKFDDIKARLNQAAATPNVTPYEMFFINNQRMVLASTMGDQAQARDLLEKVVTSEYLPKAERPRLIEVLYGMYFNEKNYPKAIEWAKTYQAESPTPSKALAVLYRAYAYSNDYAHAKDALMAQMAESAKNGVKANKEDLNNLAFMANKMKDENLYRSTLEQLTELYPSEEYWLDLLNHLRRVPGYANTLELFVLRLQMQVTSKLPDEYYYTDLAEADLQEGFFTEAKQVMDAGYEAGVLGTGNNVAKQKALRAKVDKGAADDAKTIASTEASAVKAKDGIGLVKLGYAYVTMGQTDKGLAFIQQGLAKGVAKRPEEAKMLLGVAQFKAKKYDDAIKTFSEVKGTDGAADLSRYWTIKIKQSMAPAPAAAAAAK